MSKLNLIAIGIAIIYFMIGDGKIKYRGKVSLIPLSELG